MQELSQRWECDLRQVKDYVFDQRLLRPAFRPRDNGEHIRCDHFCAEWIMGDFSLFDLDFEAWPSDQWVYLGIKDPVHYEAVQGRERDIVIAYAAKSQKALKWSWSLELELQDFEGNSLHLFQEGTGIGCFLLSRDHRDGAMIPREEVERFEQSVNLTPAAKPDLTNKEKNNLLAMLGMLVKQVMADHNNCRKADGAANVNTIAKLLQKHLPDDVAGLSDKNIRSKLADALAILDTRGG